MSKDERRVWQKDELLLTIHDTSHFSKGNAAMCHGANKNTKRLETGKLGTVKLGLGNWDCETVKLGTGKLGTVKLGLGN